MNLHLIPDEKVVSRTITYFEQALPHQNKYVVTLSKGQNSSKYVKGLKGDILFIEYGANDFWEKVGDVKTYKNVIIHFLTGFAVDFINLVQHPNITWVVWGADLYGDLLAPKGYKLFYDPQAIRKIENAQNTHIKALLIRVYKKYRYKSIVNAVKKVSNLCIPNGDLDLFKYYYPEMSSKKKLDFFYYPLDDIISKDLIDNQTIGNDIIVGNSASYYGNHEEVFLQLAQLNIKNRRVITPLSYGPSKMIEFIIKKGNEIIGDNFMPVKDFMPLRQYNQLLISARTFIYGNYRQEATGNIIVALYLGGTVFLHPSNPLLKDFRELGCVCFTTDDLAERIDYELTIKEKEINKTCLIKAYNKDRLLDLIKTNFG